MFLLLFVLVVIYAFQSFFCRQYTSARSGSGAIQFSVFYSAFAGICTLAVNGFAYKPSGITVILGLINAMVLLIYNLCMVNGGNLGSYAFLMISNLSGGILVPMVYDMLYLNFSFSTLQIIAIVLMLASFAVLNLDGIKAKKNLRYLLWCLTLFFANGFYAVFMNLQQTMMEFTQRNEMIITTFLGMAVLTSLFELVVHRQEFIGGFHMSKKALLSMILSSVCATLAVNMLMYVMKSINVTVLGAVTNGGVLVLSSIFAFTFFKEKLVPNTLIGILMACASIIMLSI